MGLSKWRSHSRQVIERTLLECEAQALCLDEPLDVDATIKEISAAYPFYDRARHPYKCWLVEFGYAKKFLLLNRPAKSFMAFCESQDRLTRPSWTAPSPGQMSLFEEAK